MGHYVVCILRFRKLLLGGGRGVRVLVPNIPYLIFCLLFFVYRLYVFRVHKTGYLQFNKETISRLELWAQNKIEDKIKNWYGLKVQKNSSQPSPLHSQRKMYSLYTAVRCQFWFHGFIKYRVGENNIYNVDSPNTYVLVSEYMIRILNAVKYNA